MLQNYATFKFVLSLYSPIINRKCGKLSGNHITKKPMPMGGKSNHTKKPTVRPTIKLIAAQYLQLSSVKMP